MSTVSATVPSPDDIDDANTGRLVDASKARIIAVIVAIVLFTEISPIQQAMVGSGLQKITHSFPGVGANINWTIIIMTLVGAAATPLLGKMADVWGKKRIFLVCGALTAVGSVICALTTTWALFLVGRGLSAAAIACQIIAWGLMRDLLPRKYIPIGLGASATGLGFSALVGPIVGGYLVDNFDWPAMFWFLAGFTVLMIPVVMFIVPESKLRVKDRIDYLGAALLAGGAALVLIYMDKGQDWHWGRPTTLAWLVVGVLLLIVFGVTQARSSRPLMDMKLLFAPKVSLVLLLGFFGVGILTVQSYAVGYMTQTPSAGQLQGTVAQSVATQVHEQTGVALPVSAVHVNLVPGYSYGSGFTLLEYAARLAVLVGVFAMIFGPVGAVLARRFGARVPAIASMVIMSAAGAAYALVSYNWVTFAVLGGLFGIGVGFFYSAATILLVDAVPQEQQGISAGMFGVVQSMGSAIMLAGITAVQNNNPIVAHIDIMGHAITQSIPQVFGDNGFTWSFWIATGAGILGLIVTIVMRQGRTPTTAGAALGLGEHENHHEQTLNG